MTDTTLANSQLAIHPIPEKDTASTIPQESLKETSGPQQCDPSTPTKGPQHADSTSDDNTDQPLPCSEALKRRCTSPNANTSPTGQRMLVDQETTSILDILATPRAHPTTLMPVKNKATQSNAKADDTTPENQENTNKENIEHTGIWASLKLANERMQQEEGEASPLVKYTKNPIPKIHDENPVALLEGLDLKQVKTWLDEDTGKLLARPFGSKTRNQVELRMIADRIKKASHEITNNQDIEVALPLRAKDTCGRGTKQPITFLIMELSLLNISTLTSRHVWSSREISFQIAPVESTCPDFLFTIYGFTTDVEAKILTCVRSLWSDKATTAAIEQIVRSSAGKHSQDQTSTLMEKATVFLNSVTIEKLKIKQSGNFDDPHFNVYARGSILKGEDGIWMEIRDHLKSHTYRTDLYGIGRCYTVGYHCGFCHGRDHPRGLCPYPNLPGWNGGSSAIQESNNQGNMDPSTCGEGLPQRGHLGAGF